MKEIIFSLLTICAPPDQFVQISDGPTPMWVQPSKVSCVHPETFLKGVTGKTVILMDSGEQFMVDEDIKHVIKALNREGKK